MVSKTLALNVMLESEAQFRRQRQKLYMTFYCEKRKEM